MLKENLIQDYQMFFYLRNTYPEHRKLISELMRYVFENNDSFKTNYVYLNGTFYETDVKFIFEKLNLSLTISKVFFRTIRNIPYTIIELISNEEKP